MVATQLEFRGINQQLQYRAKLPSSSESKSDTMTFDLAFIQQGYYRDLTQYMLPMLYSNLTILQYSNLIKQYTK